MWHQVWRQVRRSELYWSHCCLAIETSQVTLCRCPSLSPTMNGSCKLFPFIRGAGALTKLIPSKTPVSRGPADSVATTPMHGTCTGATTTLSVSLSLSLSLFLSQFVRQVDTLKAAVAAASCVSWSACDGKSPRIVRPARNSWLLGIHYAMNCMVEIPRD